jgi:hypothetical protein
MLVYFLQPAGEPLTRDFARGRYGPCTDKLRAGVDHRELKEAPAMTTSSPAGAPESVTGPRCTPVFGQDACSRRLPHVGTLGLGG